MILAPQFFIMGAQRIAPTAEVLSWNPATSEAAISCRSDLPDCIGPKASHDPLFVSERIAADLKSAAVTGGDLAQAKLKHENGKGADLTTEYFRLKAIGHARAYRNIYSKQGSELLFIKKVVDQGDALMAQVRRSPRNFVVQWVIDEQEWEGSDFLNTQFSRMFGEICCTFKVVELAKNKGWTGIAFTAFDSIARNYVDFSTLGWPPESWYPNDQPPYYKMDGPDIER